MPSSRDLLVHGAAELGITLSKRQIAQVDQYIAELLKWNQRINLTAAKTRDELVIRHVLDSLAGGTVLASCAPGAAIADLGAGAGFPGLPIRIARPDLNLTLIEPRQKRAAFLTTICGLLGLEHVAVSETSIEPTAAPVGLAGRFDAVLMRAVTDPMAAKALAAPLVKPGGMVVIWASSQQANAAGPGFSVHWYRLPATEISHALLVWRPTE